MIEKTSKSKTIQSVEIFFSKENIYMVLGWFGSRVMAIFIPQMTKAMP